MLKIYTLNYYYGNNYGAVLEAYALQKSLEIMGYQTSCINYKHNEHFAQKLMRRIRWALMRPKMFFHYINVILNKNLNNNYNTKHYIRSDQSSFSIFRSKYLKIDIRNCRSSKDLDSKLDNVKACICGSDVIWAKGDNSLDIDAYFLNWGRQSMKRVAYAPSWGTDSIDSLNKDTRNKIAYCLSKFDYVSVREKSGIDICNKLGREDAQWMPDPTLLLTMKDWNCVADPNTLNTAPYLLHYFVPYNQSLAPESIIKTVSQRLSINVVIIPDISKQDLTQEVWPSPSRWISYIRDSDFIVTNSFHGVVFSIVFHRPFVFTLLEGKDAPKNERLFSLLEKFNISERIVPEYSEELVLNIINTPINWDEVDSIISGWRKEGLDFLKDALDN